MNRLITWLTGHNSHTKFLTLSAMIAAIIFLDPLREHHPLLDRKKRVLHAGTFVPLLPPPTRTGPAAEMFTEVQMTEEPVTNKQVVIADSTPTSKIPNMRRRVAQLLQRMRQNETGNTKQRNTFFPTTDAQVDQLMTAADRYMCTTEMATLLAIMNVGGPQRLLYWDNEWDATTSRAVYRIHHALRKGCRDDIEFALKLYAAWSETRYQEQSLVPTWALRETWQPYRLPVLPKPLEETLGSHLARFKKDIGKAYDMESIDLLMNQYGVKDVADAWFTAVKIALQQARQEAWARAFFVHHGLLAYQVEPERARLLAERSVNKKITEHRPLNFDLLTRLRILFAYYLVQNTETDPTVVPALLALEPNWLVWLNQHERSALALARFIAQQTLRNQANELQPTFTDQRLFLDQRVPLGSRYVCTITEINPDGTFAVAFARHLTDAMPTIENFRGEAGLFGREQLSSYASEYERKESVEEALLTTAQSQPLPQRRALTGITGRLCLKDMPQMPDDEAKEYHVNDTLLVEVVDYTFDPPESPLAIVAPIPTKEPFCVFNDLYQVGDMIVVRTLGYDERPQDTLISLIVEEPRSQLTILLEPEQLSFTPLGEAVKEIAPGTLLHVMLEEVDTLRHTVTLSLLPLMEVHLDKILKSLPAENNIYQANATISKVFNDTLLLVLHWSDPALGLIYALNIPRSMLPNPQQTCAIGDQVTLNLLFPDHVTSPEMHRLPGEVRQVIELTHQQRFSLYWDQHCLHFHGQMPYHVRNKLLLLSADKTYQYSIRNLYRHSYQFLTEVQTITTPAAHEKRAGWLEEEEQLDYVRVLDNNEPQSESSSEAEELDEKLDEEISYPQVDEGTDENYLLPPIMKYQAGQIVEGRVTGVQSYGAFVEIEAGVSGLVHKSKMWGYVPDMSEIVHMGDEIKVFILNVNIEQSNLELSMQLPEYDPLRNYEEGDTVTGRVTDIQEFGAFVQVEPGVSGLVHKSKMWGYVSDVAHVVSIGDEVTVRILTINREKHWLELSMQVAEHDPLLRYKVGEIVMGVVTDVKDFGAFVEVEPGASGLIYKSDIRENVTDARRELFVGDEIDVLIVRIDMERRHMALSMKDI